MNSIIDHSVREHAENLRRKEYSARELVTAYLDEAESERSKDINAYVTLCAESALETADICDGLFADKSSDPNDVSSLWGIPVAVKDNIMTSGVRTSCASRMLENYVPPYDATAVAKLKAAGAIIIGKTNLDEFAMGCTTRNSIFGSTKNPFDNSLTPGGSSGGSAAAVSAHLVPAALGSDTGGSARQPASFCGAVALNPTYGRVSRYGLCAFASSLDRIAPITQTVYDSAMIMNAIMGHDIRDATSAKKRAKDLTCGIDGGIKGLKIGIIDGFSDGVIPEIAENVGEAVKILRSLGAVPVKVTLDSAKYALAVYHIISSAEASSNLGRFDGVRYGHRTNAECDSIDELITKSRSEGFGSEVKRRIMTGTFVLSGENRDEYYGKALALRGRIKREFDEALKKCDIILSPAVTDRPFPLSDGTDIEKIYSCDKPCLPSSLAELPSVTVPFGKYDDGLPMSVMFTGRAFDEKTLLRAAYAMEGKSNG